MVESVTFPLENKTDPTAPGLTLHLKFFTEVFELIHVLNAYILDLYLIQIKLTTANLNKSSRVTKRYQVFWICDKRMILFG